MKFNIFLYPLIITGLYSCQKFLDVAPPKDQITSAQVYASDATAISVVRGIYSQMINGSGFASGGSSSITLLAGLSSDELVTYVNDPAYLTFYSNSLSPINFQGNLWSEPYKYINNANALMEGLKNSTAVNARTKNELTGEAKFIRAFCFFYLVNLFGDVPLILTTDYNQNALASRTAKADVYQQIIADLQDAQNALADDYSFSEGEADQPNRWAATAMLARAYLFTGDWINAEAHATLVIDNPTFRLTNDLDSVFLANSPEAIWQLKPDAADYNINTNEGFMFILTSNPYYAALSDQLLNAFEPADNRKTKWVNSFTDGTSAYYYPFKYKIQTGSDPFNEYSMVIRLAEMYLIRAEARARQNKIDSAREDLDKIRTRAGLANTSASSKPDLLSAILHERQTEMFSEWGHRWLDLIRTGSADSVMAVVTPQKGGSWSSHWQLYPIPQADILSDIHLNQNPGY